MQWLIARRSVLRSCGWLVLLAMPVAQAAEPAQVGNTPAWGGPQVMMYFQLGLGHSSQPLAMYGLRLEQTRLQSGLVPTGLTPVPYHQQLLDLQLRPHADMQIQFGRRLAWDFERASFSSASKNPTLVLRWPIQGERSGESQPLAMLSDWPRSTQDPPSR